MRNFLYVTLPTTRGCFYILSEFIRLLKEANIYDNTAILLCSDHGARGSLLYRTACDMTFMIKPFHVSKAEVLEDDSPVQSLDILPALLKMICGDDADFTGFEGCPSFDVPDKRIRKVYGHGFNKAFPDIDGWDGQGHNCLNEFNFINLETFSFSTESNSFIRSIPFLKEKMKD